MAFNDDADDIRRRVNQVQHFRQQEQSQRQAFSNEQRFERPSFSADDPRQVYEDLLRQTPRNQLSAEELFMLTLLQVNRAKVTRTRIQSEHGDRFINETVEASRINPQTGALEEIQETRVTMLDDGMPSQGDIGVCASCFSTLRTSGFRLCPGCRKMLCWLPTCSKSRRGELFFHDGWCVARWFFLGAK